MQYNIVKITDLKGNDKTDLKATGRLGRIVELDADDIKIGKSCFLECVIPGVHKSLITSNVLECIEAEDGLIIKTENSYYYLVDVDNMEFTAI